MKKLGLIFHDDCMAFNSFAVLRRPEPTQVRIAALEREARNVALPFPDINDLDDLMST